MNKLLKKEINNTVIYTTSFLVSDIVKLLSKEIIQLENKGKCEWNLRKKSRFIESLILGFPVPFLVLRKNSKNNYTLLDGNQRILAIKQFYNNEYNLQLLEFLEYDKMGYQDINFEDLDMYQIKTVIIKNTTDEIAESIKNRLNQKIMIKKN